MFRVVNNWDYCNGGSLRGYISLVYSDIVLAFGEPMPEGDEYKVSSEWIFYNDETGEHFTLYDWKSTNLYDDELPSVEEFRASQEPYEFHIGGESGLDVESVKELIRRQIDYVKNGNKYIDQYVLDQKESENG